LIIQNNQNMQICSHFDDLLAVVWHSRTSKTAGKIAYRISKKKHCI